MRNTNRHRFCRWALAGGLLVVALLPAIALARAGGGEGYHGDGGGGGGGDGGGGDGIGLLFYFLIQLVFRYPIVGIPLLILVIVGFVIAQKKGTQAYQGSVISRGAPLAEAAQLRPQLQSLMGDDSQFQLDAFLARVRKAFLATQSAWSKQDLAPVRPFLSDGVFERFNIQFAEQKMMGYRNDMANVMVLSTDVVQADVDEVFQTLAVRISAVARDSNVSLNDNSRLSGGQSSEFTEIWTFLRKRGVQTKLDAAGLIEGNCPNCGSAIEMNQHAKCQSCGALLRSGQYDWVLTEITQECEWRQRRTQPPGVSALRQRDPNFATAALEDTASVIFWRLNAARRQAKPDPIRKMATDQFCQQYMQALKSDGPRLFYSQCAVGSVHTLGVYQADGWDRAVMEIMWSGTRSTLDAAGQVQELGPIGPARLLLVLARQANTLSRVDTAISSAHCPSCGAPQRETTANACESCGSVLNDGKLSWVLLQAEAGMSPAAASLLDQMQAALSDLPPVATPSPATPVITPPLPRSPSPTPGQSGTLAWIVQMAASDGQISPEEQDMLQAAAAKWGVPQDRLAAMIQAALTGHLQPTQPADADEARTWLAAMVRISLADGKITTQEYRLLQTAAQRCGLADYDLKTLINQTHAKLYAESRSALKAARTPQQVG